MQLWTPLSLGPRGGGRVEPAFSKCHDARLLESHEVPGLWPMGSSDQSKAVVSDPNQVDEARLGRLQNFIVALTVGAQLLSHQTRGLRQADLLLSL